MTIWKWILSQAFLSSLLFADPVICIHGFMRNSNCMKLLAQELESMGHTPYLFDYKSRSKTIEGHAEDLVELIKGLDETPHFVTHSLGGLIVRSALNHPDCPSEAKGGRIIMLAPPHQGSKTARFCGHLVPVRRVFGDQVGKQLIQLDGAAVEALGPLPHIVVIAGSRDWKVSIAETRPNEPHTHHVVKSGHCFIMRNKQTINLIKRSLTASSAS